MKLQIKVYEEFKGERRWREVGAQALVPRIPAELSKACVIIPHKFLTFTNGDELTLAIGPSGARYGYHAVHDGTELNKLLPDSSIDGGGILEIKIGSNDYKNRFYWYNRIPEAIFTSGSSHVNGSNGAFSPRLMDPEVRLEIANLIGCHCTMIRRADTEPTSF